QPATPIAPSLAVPGGGGNATGDARYSRGPLLGLDRGKPGRGLESSKDDEAEGTASRANFFKKTDLGEPSRSRGAGIHGWRDAEPSKQPGDRVRQAGGDGKELASKDKESKEGLDVATFYVREFANRRQLDDNKADAGFRHDDTDTVYWHPALFLGNGNGRISFDLGDAVTSYQVTVFG